MPKIVDHELRRQELAAAVWRAIAARGIDGASVREVARQSGWSPGALRHYLPTQDELLLVASRAVSERVHARIAAVPREGRPLEVLSRQLREALPLDDERRLEAEVWFAFLGRSIAHAGLAAERQRLYAGIRSELGAGLAPYLAPGRDPDDVAGLVFAGVDGIALQALADRQAFPAGRQLGLLDDHLARTLPELRS